MFPGMPFIDPQENGWAPTRNPGGVIQVQPFGSLVRMPFCAQASVWNNLTWEFGAGGGLSGDGAGQAFTVAPPAALPSLTYDIRFPFRGTVFGVRFDPNAATGGFYRDFGVFIDAEAFPVSKPILDNQDNVVYASSHEVGVIVAAGLPPGSHVAHIVLPADPIFVAEQYLSGYLVEESAGYSPVTRLGYLNAPTLLGTSFTAPSLNSSAAARSGCGLRSILYYNATGSPVTVTLQWNGQTFWQASVAPNSQVAFDPMVPIPLDSQIRHAAAASSAIYYALVGVM